MSRCRAGAGTLSAVVLLFAVFVLAPPAFSQATGQLRGKVVDAKGDPVENAKITIEFMDGINRRHTTKTNRRGEFVQIGLTPGNYKVTVEKDRFLVSSDVRVRLGDTAEVGFELAPVESAGPSAEEVERAANVKTLFEEGLALSDAGNHDAAIAKVREVMALVPKCAECYSLIGSIQVRQSKFDEAEASFKEAIAINPELGDAYSGLANVYNSQKKFDLAAQMGAEAAKRSGAAGGGSANATYNQGVIFWNSNKFAEAAEQFEQAVGIDPKHAQAHFMLGKVYLNLGKLEESVGEFETYLTLEPSGPNAKEATDMVEQLKPLLKK